MALSFAIPQDVVDIITSHLDSDVDALKRCSLVSRSCRAASQRHLFSTVALYSASRCQQLKHLLTDNPYLTTYIRHLCLDGKQKPLDPRRSHCWVFEATLPSVLTSLRVQSLSLHNIYWGELSPELQRAFIGNLQTPGLFSVDLNSVHSFPTQHLQSLPSLKRLVLLSLSGTSKHACPFTFLPSLKTRQLHTLEFDQRIKSMKSVLELRDLWDMSQLRELSITGSGGGMLDVASSLLTSASHSLKLFAWQFQCPYRIVSKPNVKQPSLISFSILYPSSRNQPLSGSTYSTCRTFVVSFSKSRCTRAWGTSCRGWCAHYTPLMTLSGPLSTLSSCSIVNGGTGSLHAFRGYMAVACGPNWTLSSRGHRGQS
jgi:hypothetical protein